MKKLIKRLTSGNKKLMVSESAMEVLLKGKVWQLSEKQRAAMTISCKDSDSIPKVKAAGSVKTVAGQKVQIMHNGLQVKLGGYYGNWMAEIIKKLRGHHEPQEEKVFHEVLKKIGSKGTMIELGSFWSYYSIWFNKTIKDAINVCCEPDPGNMDVGKENAKLNGADLKFVHAAAGSETGKRIEFTLESKPGETLSVPIMSVDDILREQKIKSLDLLHMDVQGVELEALRGAEQSIKAGKVRFVIVSTHHYLFSKDPMTHIKCINYIKSLGGHIIASHTVAESYSGDGLIVASFDGRDRHFTIPLSNNHTDQSLFRPHENDLSILIDAYDELLEQGIK